MKTFYIIFLFVFLASCGANTATQVINETNNIPTTEEVIANIEQDVPTETEEVSDSEPDPEPTDITPPSEQPPVIPEDIKSEIEAPSEQPPVIPTEVEGEAWEAPSEQPPVIEETTDDIDAALEEIDDNTSDESTAKDLIEISTTYTNPATEAIMNIALEVDDNNTITSIEVTSPNYKGMRQFNSAAQAVVGKSLQEASEFYVSGSSLASPAFQKAIKSKL